MGRLIIHRQVRLAKNTHLNVGKGSKPSVTHKFGRFTWNSKGGLTLHVMKGVSFKLF